MHEAMNASYVIAITLPDRWCPPRWALPSPDAPSPAPKSGMSAHPRYLRHDRYRSYPEQHERPGQRGGDEPFPSIWKYEHEAQLQQNEWVLRNTSRLLSLQPRGGRPRSD